MGQINCQQCTIHQSPSLITTFDRKLNHQYPPPRINILSKNRNSIQILNKKYSIQTTQEDIEEVSVQNRFIQKEKCLLMLQNEKQVFSVQIQKGKKAFLGTSKNCHLNLSNKNTQDKFKVQLQYSGTQITATDMGVGVGSYIKSQKLELKQSTEKLTQIYLIDGNLIRFTVNLITEPIKSLKVCIQDMKSQHSNEFIFDCIDILLNRQNRRTFQANQSLQLDFEIKKSSYQSFQFYFNHKSCWKYLKSKTVLKEQQVLSMGFSFYTVKNIFFYPDLSNQSDIKIIDSN